ncbi:copper amine oxidase N-terminal domain-containing protein [Paenibacillus tepidiphilus]|uniref:copper amine oxidase N-terminal domain-containing protein n=1 Tax=Paenibacillus tepidiphilus TaxID=2608683 RepID=UPI00123C4649|nr:copper amine oxidase N-terminal domain-containing protein [Paenibacillus tepidiphilus]
MKKNLKLAVLSLALFNLAVLTPVHAAAEPKISVDGKLITTDVAPYIVDGTTFVPLEMVKNLKGIQLVWNNSTKTVTLDANQKEYQLKTGEAFARSGSKTYTLPAAAEIKHNRLMVPIRFVAEVSGAAVSWDAAQRTVVIIQAAGKTEKAQLVVTDTEKHVKLFNANETLKTAGEYEGVYLEIDGKQQYFDWKVVTDPTREPQLSSTDLTGDGVKDAVAILTVGWGTGLSLQEVHVVDGANLKEIQVINPLETLEKEVSSQMTKKGDGLDITMTVQGQKVSIHEPGPIYNMNKNGKVGFGSIVNYLVEDGKLVAKIAANISITEYIGDFTIVYEFEKNQLQSKMVEFKAY